MPIEQRVVAQPKIGAQKIGAKSVPTEPTEAPKPKKSKSGRKKLVLLLTVVLVGIAAAGYFLVLAPSSHPSSSAAPPAPSPGVVVTLDAHSLNLADGHYLRIGIALQMTESFGKSDPETAAAQDAVVTTFSGHTVTEIQDPTIREQLRQQLLVSLQKIYGKNDLMGVYFTDYVTQ